MTTYSSLLWQGELSTTVTNLFSVPAAELWIIRDVEYFNATANSSGQHLQLTAPGFTPTPVCRVNSIPSAEGAQWQGRVVVPGNGSVQAASAALGWYVAISGYQFSN